MRKALFEDTEYPYLLSGAKARLKDARRMARRAGLDTQNIVALGDNLFCVFPWMGLRAYLTLERCLKYLCKDSLQLTEVWPFRPHFLNVKLRDGNLSKLRQEIISLREKQFEAEDLVGAADLPMLRQLEKYNEFVPDDLLLKSFANDWLDIDEMKVLLRDWS